MVLTLLSYIIGSWRCGAERHFRSCSSGQSRSLVSCGVLNFPLFHQLYRLCKSLLLEASSVRPKYLFKTWNYFRGLPHPFLRSHHCRIYWKKRIFRSLLSFVRLQITRSMFSAAVKSLSCDLYSFYIDWVNKHLKKQSSF